VKMGVCFFGWRICQGIDLLIAFLELFKMSKRTWGQGGEGG
jgi:hypothetical protein